MRAKLELIRFVRIVLIGMAMATVLFSLTELRQGRAQSPAGAAASQTSAADPQSFEVASIRPSGQVTRGTPLDVMQVTPGGRWTASTLSVSKLMQTAYDVKPFQISGGPSWLDKERYDIKYAASLRVTTNPTTTPVIRSGLCMITRPLKSNEPCFPQTHLKTGEIPQRIRGEDHANPSGVLP